MKQLFISLLFTIAFNITRAQGDAKQLIGEGVALHDKGDFKGAIAKYDAALQVDPANSLAMYEKSYSLMALKKHNDAEELLCKILKESKDPDIRKLCYVNYGSLLDFEGKGKKSLKLYEDGIKEF
ncbi:MAG TPA: tetratricopeptide repeat protein, partial [Chitinophagaceae bacterium]|nr:tetratricopeptide repeat protein [Chitinophagaceae bacterium]